MIQKNYLYQAGTSCSPTARVKGSGQMNYTDATKERKTCPHLHICKKNFYSLSMDYPAPSPSYRKGIMWAAF